MKVTLCQIEDLPRGQIKTVEFLDREVLIYEIEGVPKAVLSRCDHPDCPQTNDSSSVPDA